MASDRPKSAAKKAPKCPVCKAATIEAYRPFCSKRCSDIDLGRWLKGTYAIAGGATGADEDGDAVLGPAAPTEPDSE